MPSGHLVYIYGLHPGHLVHLDMNAAVLLLLVILSVELKGEFEASGDDRCPEVTVNLTRKPAFASSTCGDDNFRQYCYLDSTDSRMRCRTCQNKDDVNASNVVDDDPGSQWISRPGLEAVNLTVDLVQVHNVHALTR